jgi:MFS family permease
MIDSGALRTARRHWVQQRRSFWRNYVAHSLEGGLFIGGMTFVAPNAVMPVLVDSLGGAEWLIALMPTMMMLGFVGPQLLTAHHVERLSRVKPFILVTGVFQRIPFLFVGLGLLFWAEQYPLGVLALVAAAPLASGIAGGLSFSAWLELTAKVIPEHRRASLWAWRAIITAGIGICAGSVIRVVLGRHPGPEGYGLLYLISLVFMVLSYATFVAIRETSPPPREMPVRRSLWANLRSLPGLVVGDAQFRNFMLVRVFTTGLFVMTPFLAIHALRTLGKEPSYIGHLVTAQMLGGLAGNFMAGWLGDRRGGKIVLVISQVLMACLGWLVVLCETEYGFLGVFFLLGAALSSSRVGLSTLGIEICPSSRRPTQMSLLSAVSFPTMLVAAALSTVLWHWTGTAAPGALVAANTALLALLFLLRIREPRARNGEGTGGGVVKRAESGSQSQ